jgi:hypothetical protein
MMAEKIIVANSRAIAVGTIIITWVGYVTMRMKVGNAVYIIPYIVSVSGRMI